MNTSKNTNGTLLSPTSCSTLLGLCQGEIIEYPNGHRQMVSSKGQLTNDAPQSKFILFLKRLRFHVLRFFGNNELPLKLYIPRSGLGKRILPREGRKATEWANQILSRQ